MSKQSWARLRAWRSSEAGPNLAETGLPQAGVVLSRRKMVTGAVGMAALGAAGGSTLVSPALATTSRAAFAQGTTVEPGAVVPAVVALTDGPTIAVDASLGNDFRVTIAANRTMGNPASPADGQKITFQITQGAAGSSTITWGNAYEFSDGLPQPALSTQAGKTDLLAFIYNGGKSKWLLAAFVNGFTSTVVIQPKGTYRLFPSTNGPADPVSYSGPYMPGVLFQVTTGGVWFDGYWWWVCPSGQSTSPQKFALWSVHDDHGGNSLISAAAVTSGPLTAGQWNYVPLNTPVPLAIGACYNACTGLNGSFPITTSQFGAGQPYGNGISNEPLQAFSDQSGSQPAPFGLPQGVFTVAGTDPTTLMPANGDQSDNLWMDLQADTNPPAGASYRLWPNYPAIPGTASGSAAGYTLATEFLLSQSCTLDNIWFYSASGATALPTRCAIWDVASQTVVAGTDNTSPSWSGAAGSGWVSCAYSSQTLSAGDYKVAVFYGGQADWFLFNTGYWGPGGPAANGIAAGP